MPVSASRPPPVNISSLLDDPCPPRRSSPPFPRPSSPSPRTPSSLPSLKPVLSPRTEKKPPLSSPSAAEEKKFEKSDHTPSPPSDSRAEPPSAVDSRPREDEESDAGDEVSALGLNFPKGIIDGETFNQILDLDEEDDREFSHQMVQDFYTQAETTFTEMDALYKEKQLAALSDKGHFLKGSSAAIGLSKVRESCEEIQNYGNLRNKANDVAITREESLELIGEVLTRVRAEYEEVKTWLDKFFANPRP